MIYYFSGTGNSEWVAKTIANRLNDNTQDVIELIKNCDDKIKISMDENIGIVFPIYAWAIPEPIDYFIKNVEFPLKIHA